MKIFAFRHIPGEAQIALLIQASFTKSEDAGNTSADLDGCFTIWVVRIPCMQRWLIKKSANLTRVVTMTHFVQCFKFSIAENTWACVTQFLSRLINILVQTSLPANIFINNLVVDCSCGFYFLASCHSNISKRRINNIKNWSKLSKSTTNFQCHSAVTVLS